MVDELQTVSLTEQTAGLPSKPMNEPMKPVAATERIHTLDVLRGFAIFGIFMVNIAFFSMPIATILDPTTVGDEPQLDQICHAFMRMFFETKFIGLFSILFGMGLIVQMQRAAKRNSPFVGLYIRRILVLMALGLVHALGLWYGDILFVYSFVAIAALISRKFQPRTMLVVAASCLLVSVSAIVVFTVLGVLFGQATAQETQSEVPVVIEEMETPEQSSIVEEVSTNIAQDDWDEFIALISIQTFQPRNEDWVQADIMAYKHGPMKITLAERAFTFMTMLAFLTISLFFFRILATFLIGMALIKFDFFNSKNRRWHVRLLAVGALLGLPGEFFLVWSYHHSGYQFGWLQGSAEVLHQFTSLFLTLGYIGAITLIVRAGALRWLTYAFSCVGRTALSNYLLQTVVATYSMYWWGLGMFNDVSRPHQLAIVASVYCCQLVLSVLYLQIFSIGPFEWLWRSLTYLKFQPILRRAPVAAT